MWLTSATSTMPPPGEGAGGGGLVEEDPDPERAEHGLEHAERADTAAGTSRAPVTKSASPRPRLSAPKPKRTSICPGPVPRDVAQAAARQAAKALPAQTAGTIRTPAKRRTMTMTAEKATREP